MQSKLQRLAVFLPCVTNSDAHNIYDFVQGPKNLLQVEELTIAELKLALAGKGMRAVLAEQFSDFCKE